MSKVKQPRTPDGKFASWNTLAKGLKKTKTSTKVSAKKTAVKKEAKIKPLRFYDSYRLSARNGYVRFGCGEVSVAREDLRRLADIMEKPSGREDLLAFYRVVNAARNRKTALDILRISPQTFRRLAAVPDGGC